MIRESYVTQRKFVAMKIRTIYPGGVLAFFGALFSTSTPAQQCDCQKVVGQCRGAIQFVRGFGSAPSFGAEIVVHSSERICSKVEYLVDGTPYQTLLVNRQKESESLFGTSPIGESSITYNACYICASSAKAPDASTSETQRAGTPSPFQGVWSGSVRWLLISADITYNISISEGRATGTSTSRGATVQIRDGVVNGDTLTYSFTGTDGSAGTGTIRLIGEGKANVSVGGLGISFTGTISRTN